VERQRAHQETNIIDEIASLDVQEFQFIKFCNMINTPLPLSRGEFEKSPPGRG
jgi:hypothetical protein